ncbi:hypothetical protein M407DRAFT_19049 [Tulasnella calospora MUT 4182]|uniref:Retrotransposon gag domain-containing protein n=1 Tax=Tulasnella calospora MUT 4182 TaxID=1051891 RepID=A0A0C3LDK8_9AGAM|nr:hypothetical protein M407DRAFT_19049 [Tulasnella calospora MUT 4182]
MGDSMDISWLTFSGGPKESASDFVQSLQRVAFQNGQVNDDRWLTQYASTCFTGDALLWYSDLDDKTRNDWSKLRSAFLRRYSTPAIIPQPAVARPAKWNIFSRRIPEPTKGRIEIFLKEHAKTLGFIAYNKNLATFSIVQNPAEAQVFSIPHHKKKSIVQIRMEGFPPDNQYPNIGLALVNNDGVEAPDAIPPPLPMNLYGELDYLKPSSLCSKDPDHGWIMGDRPMATWAFRACTESSALPRQRRSAKTSNSLERASSAIWKHDKRSNKLTIIWVMDNDKEGELRVIVPDNLPDNLHVHRVQDWKRARSRLKEKEAGLYFVPDEST